MYLRGVKTCRDCKKIVVDPILIGEASTLESVPQCSGSCEETVRMRLPPYK